MQHFSNFIPLIIFVALAIIAWVLVERFSPDPVITKICQIVIFVIVLIKALTLLS